MQELVRESRYLPPVYELIKEEHRIGEVHYHVLKDGFHSQDPVSHAERDETGRVLLESLEPAQAGLGHPYGCPNPLRGRLGFFGESKPD